LTQIYVDGGLDRDLAEEVAVQFTKHDALGSHGRDELGVSEGSFVPPCCPQTQ
jgi:hypothetical protein